MHKKLLSISVVLMIFGIIFTTVSCIGEFYIGNIIPKSTSYITFTGSRPFSIKVYDETKRWVGTLEYSTDTDTWNKWDGTSINSASDGEKAVLYIRGYGNSVITGASNNARWIIDSSENDIECNGDIRSLLDYENPEESSMGENCFRRMFYGCTSLIKAPDLPATTLVPSCYSQMFAYCTYLETTPALPATTLAASCYSSMFQGCTSLTTAPALRAQTLTDHCYQMMFYGCTALNTVPYLHAETLTEGCYSYMFYECTSLYFYADSQGDDSSFIQIGTDGTSPCPYMMFLTNGDYESVSASSDYVGKTIYTTNTIIR